MYFFKKRNSILRNLILIVSAFVCCYNIVSAQSLSDPDGVFSGSEHFDIIELRTGVWIAAHRNAGFAVSNAGIVDLGDKTLVFDTFLTPEAGRDLRRAAEELTGRFVSLVANSHYHNDHIRGNQEFLPEATIIGNNFTRTTIVEKEPLEIADEKIYAPERLAEFPSRREYASVDAIPEIDMWIDYYRAMLASHTELRTSPPDLVTDGRVDVSGPDRQAFLISLGPGHTQNDMILHLPDDDVVFMGDLLFVERHPWLGSGSPAHWIRSLEMVASWQPADLIPGHGPVRGKGSLNEMIAYIQRLSELASDPVGVDDDAIPAAFQNWWYARFFQPNMHFLRETHAAKTE